jgi:outer membrane translocation and assembly module TamA
VWPRCYGRRGVKIRSARGRVGDRLAIVAWTLSALLVAGCASVPPGRAAIDDVTVTGTSRLDDGAMKDELATAPSPKFLGLFRGFVYDYETLDDYGLQRDLGRVERFCRARGFYDAHARAGRVIPTSSGHVRVEIVVEEGAPVTVQTARFVGIDGLPADAKSALERVARRRLRRGEPFDEDAFAQAETEALRALTDRGYAFAKVKTDASVDLPRHAVDVTLTVDAGPVAAFGKVTIVGLEPRSGAASAHEIPEAPLRRAIAIEEGQRYSTAVVDAASQALLDLEIFASVQVVPEVSDPPPASPIVPVTVTVEPGRLRQLRIGGGVEFDQIKTDLHAVFGWEDHNFLGGLRDFSIDFRPGMVLYPTRIDSIVAPERLLFEERLRLQLKQPGFLEPRTTGFVRPELNVFPLLVQIDSTSANPVVNGYIEGRAAIGVERTFDKLYASIAQNVQIEHPFAYKGTLDPALRTLFISYPELVTHLDLRNNRLHPRRGIYLANALQIAGGPFLGDATDLKIQPEVRTYLPIGRRITFATRATIGLLLPTNYGSVVKHALDDPLTPANSAERVRDLETVFFRGFFSGGPTSNRGFPIRGVAPHGVVPFLIPATAAQQVASQCDPTKGAPDPSLCSNPVGGFTLWELSNELRIAVAGPLSTALFCDMSDVSPREVNFRFDHLHLSCGAGVRYDTPVGPIRLDVGYRVQPLQVIGHASEGAAHAASPSEGVQPRLFGLPIAIAIGIGEAY